MSANLHSAGSSVKHGYYVLFLCDVQSFQMTGCCSCPFGLIVFGAFLQFELVSQGLLGLETYFLALS
jgi:hypothetical protein